MSWTGNFITKKDLGIAYRKAKADLYYERDHPNALVLCKYEEALHANLNTLFAKLASGSLAWMKSPEFLGTWAVMPKAIPPAHKLETGSWQPSDPDEAWRVWVEAWKAATQIPRARSGSAKRDGQNNKPLAQFRLVGVHSIDFHVVGALWMLKVGHLYDEALSKDAYANRLRRTRSSNTERNQSEINRKSLGSFQHYFGPFAAWRDNGLHAMRAALDQGKHLVAITADVRQFYHKTSPDFLLNEKYLKLVGLDREIGENEREFTLAIIDALHAWAAQTPVHRSNPGVGLPVGLPAARLIANVALAELDKVIRKELAPLYYGRYVDDILLVLEDTRGFKGEYEVWDYICRRTGNLLRLARKDGPTEVRFVASYLGRSEIVLVGNKQKVFLLNGTTGKTLLKSIEHQILSRASQWQALPERPVNADALAADLINAWRTDGEQVDNLRKAESLSIRRAALAIRLRDMEAFEQDLPVKTWSVQRRAFLEAMMDHLLSLPKFFDFAVYFPRVFGLAIGCCEYELAKALLHRLNGLIDQVQNDCRVTLVASGRAVKKESIILSWRQHLLRGLSESLAAALGPDQAGNEDDIEPVLEELHRLAPSTNPLVTSADDALGWARRLFWSDMGRVPFRMLFFERQFPHFETKAWAHSDPDTDSLSKGSAFEWEHLFEYVGSFLKQVGSNGSRIPKALLYPTRPFHIEELYLLIPDLLTGTEPENIKKWALAFRGFLPSGETPGARSPIVVIPRVKTYPKQRIAVTSWETSIASWTASVAAQPDPDAKTRYERLNRLMNAILSAKKRPNYVVLHELSIPWQWFRRTASKLRNVGISLIAGIEYLPHQNGKAVANQVWASLVTDFLGFPSSVVYRQDKERAALHEELELQRIAGLQLVPLRSPVKCILRHGNFQFGILVCSELTNVQYRQNFRGNVDALFVPEWNQDTETFSSLVEASALDIHAFLVQCNNRLHGDSWIRSPSSKAWDRDIVRVKGGIEDYFVVGEIDVTGLRAFQSNYRSPTKGPFKPVPDGFKIHDSRERLPWVKGQSE